MMITHNAEGVPRRSRARSVALIGSLGALAALTLGACSADQSTDATASTTESGPVGTGQPTVGGDLTVALTAIPAVIDRYATTLGINWTPMANMCEPLFATASDFSIQPMLVDTYSYDEDLTYVFTLRSGITFHDGQPLTGADVVANIERFMLTPGEGTLLAGLVDTVEATGELEVTMTLLSPSAIVPTLLTTAYIMPASIQEGRDITDPVTDIVCTGPYQLESYEMDREVTLTRFEDFVPRDEEASGTAGGKNAYADRILFVPVPESSAQVQALQTGEVDMTSMVPLDTYDTMESSSGISPLLLPPSSGSTVVFNKTAGVMSNVKMRQAFLAALDATQIMGAGFGNPDFYELDGSVIPAVNSVWYTEAGLENYNQADVDKVAGLLDEAGYNGEEIVWMTTKADPSWYLPAEPAAQLLKEAGLNIDLQVMDIATLIERRTDSAEYDLFSSGIPTYADPLLLPYLQDAFPGEWTNPEKNELLTELSAAPSTEERQAIWAELQELIYTDVPFLKFGTTRPLLGVSDDLVIEDPNGLMFAVYYNVAVTSEA